MPDGNASPGAQRLRSSFRHHVFLPRQASRRITRRDNLLAAAVQAALAVFTNSAISEDFSLH